MKKIARVFIVAVAFPSLVLAGLAIHSLKSQQMILERQQFLYCQGVADAIVANLENLLADQQHEFAQRVESLLASADAGTLSTTFDERIRKAWAPAEVGFVVNSQGNLSCPSPAAGPAAAYFCAAFGEFLGNRQSAEVYVNSSQGKGFNGNFNIETPNASADNNFNSIGDNNGQSKQNLKGQFAANNIRSVVPQQQIQPAQNSGFISKVSSSEAEFRQLVGDSSDGTVARFVDNRLNVLLWHRSLRDTNFIFGTQLSLPRLKEQLKPIVTQLSADLGSQIVIALLDDMARPVAVSRPNFSANWKRPFVASEVGEALPHWELAVYLLNPEEFAQAARTLNLTFGLLIAVLLVAIALGGWLIFADLNRQLTLARQKTDFVSNVSHELKTPLTSIRMFSELLAEGRVTEPGKRQSYLNIITAETSRLTRLINNVLDFSRMERGEKKYNLQPCDVAEVVRETVETYRPHLESNGFRVEIHLPKGGVSVNCDRDALAQVVVNLLSNGEKYSNGRKEITVEVEKLTEPLPHVEVRVLDRGSGVPRGFEEKIFEQFFRAHDSLSSGVQGSGLGLTLARQIARAHGGNVIYQPRPGGGSCFILRLPFSDSNAKGTA